MESDYSAREMVDVHFMCDRANGNSQDARRLYAEFSATNYSPNVTSDSANLGLLLLLFSQCIMHCYPSIQ